MPIYEYSCDQCNHDFEQLVQGKQSAECPSCHGGKLTRKLSLFSSPTTGSGVAPNNVCDPLPGGG